ncbi:MAG: hypothetical protein ACC630_09200 [Nitrospinota bacterium]
MFNIVHIIIGSLVLSVIHALIPNHWIPILVIGKAENWTHRETLLITAISGIAHTTSTIIIGIAVGITGLILSSTYEFVTGIAAPSFMIIIGMVYIFLDLSHSHTHDHLEIESGSKRSKIAIITSLATMMFFSPCLEIEAFYFTAGTLGWLAIIVVSIVYMTATVVCMVFLVNFSLKRIEKIHWHFLENHNKLVTGVILIVLGIFAYFIRM